MVIRSVDTFKCEACGNNMYCVMAMINSERPVLSFVCPRGGTFEAVWVHMGRQEVQDETS